LHLVFLVAEKVEHKSFNTMMTSLSPDSSAAPEQTSTIGWSGKPTCQMVTTSMLFNDYTAFRTRLRAHLLDRSLALLVLRLLGLVAATSTSVGLPGSVARQTDLVLAVRTCGKLLAALVVLAVLDGEV
jgi:hypothetical protein